MNIEQLDLYIRSYNILKRSGINFVEELCEMTKEDIRRLKNVNRRVLSNIEDELAKIGKKLKSE